MKKITQLLSITLSSAMVLTSAPWPVTAAGPISELPVFAQALAPAESLGYVASSYAPSSDVSHPRLIVIADLHAHVEVQHHIVDMLDTLVSKLTTGPQAEKQVPIFVEGGWQAHLEHPLQSVKNPKLRSVMAEYLLQKAEIPATQAFSERHPNATNFTLTGVEDKAQYDANGARFLETYPVRRRLLEAIARHEDTFREMAGSMEARSYEKLQDMRQGYQAGTLPGDRYARALLHHADHFQIQGRFIDILRQPNATSNPQFDLALSEVSRLVSAELAKTRPLAAFFRGDESTYRENIATVDAYLDLLKRTLSDQLTPEEVPLAYARVPQMEQVAKILLADEALDIDVRSALEKSLAFYPFAFMRNESIVENSLAALQKGAPSDTGILVVGGFHSEAISQYLQEHQIAYVLINPVVSRDLTTTEQINYVERIAGVHITPEEVRADFSHPLGQTVAARASTSVTPANFDKTAPTGPQGEKLANTVEKSGALDENGTPTDPTNNGGAASVGATVPEFAEIEAAARANVLVPEVNNNALLEAANGVASDEILATVHGILEANKAVAPIEVKPGSDASQRVVFQRTDSGYTSTAGSVALASKFKTLLGLAIAQAQKTGTLVALPNRFIILPMNGDAMAKYSLSYDKTVKSPSTPFYMMPSPSGEDAVLFVNESYLPAIEQTDETFLALGRGEKVSPGNIDAAFKVVHEFLHRTTGNTTVEGEFNISRAAVFAMWAQVLRDAVAQGIGDAATAGLQNRISVSAANQIVTAIASTLPVSAYQVMKFRLANRLAGLFQGGQVSISGLESRFDNIFNPVAYVRVTRARVALQEAAMKERIAQKLGATPYQVGEAIDQSKSPLDLGMSAPSEAAVEQRVNTQLKEEAGSLRAA